MKKQGLNSGLRHAASDVGTDIPSSVVSQYDAQAVTGKSDGDPITTWTDQQGTADATGSGCTYRSSGINSNPTIEFDGKDDYFTASIGSYSQPNTFIIVYSLDVVTSGDQTLAGAGTGSNFHFFRQRASEWQHYAGTALKDGSPTTNAEIGTLIFDGANAKFRVNGTDLFSGDIGSNGLTDLSIGRRSDQSQYLDGRLGEVLVYNSRLTSSEISDEESRLSNKWGISI